MDAKEIQEKIDILQKEVSTVIKGKDEVIRKVIMAILASGHVLLRNVLLYRKRFPDRPPCSMVCRVSISAYSVWEHAEGSVADRLGAYLKRELPGVLF